MTEARAFRSFRFPAEVILWAVRWYLQFPISYRDLEVSVGYGSHAGVPANSTVLDGNSQYTWVPAAGTHTIDFAVDVDNQVIESNDSNNKTSVAVTVP
jgi:hypothetical protein